MSTDPRARRFVLIAAAVILALAAAAGLAMRGGGERPALGLFTTLPIYWPEASGVSDLLAADHAQPWVRTALEQGYRPQPLDLLEPVGAGEDDPLRSYDYLLLAQPRALSPAENVALDAWVRAGGRLLLFADPMLTAETIHPIGDVRRPQDIALLSPILGHWGLRLEFDDTQPAGPRMARLFDTETPVDLPGRLRIAAAASGVQCEVLSDGLGAQCAIGGGRVLIVADAALLDDDAEPDSRESALAVLLDRAFRSR